MTVSVRRFVAAAALFPWMVGACGRTGLPHTLEQRECFGELGSFATEVLLYDPRLGGGDRPADAYADPRAALGPPNYVHAQQSGAVAMGQGGRLELGFGDCRLFAGGDAAADVRVFEVGPAREQTFVAVHIAAESLQDPMSEAALGADAEGYLELGLIEGSMTDIDIDPWVPREFIDEVAIDAIAFVDDPAQGGLSGTSPGADIDAVQLLTGG